MVKSRWGLKLHQPNCTCGVCKSKRKEHVKGFKQKATHLNDDLSSKPAVTPKHEGAWTEDTVLASSDLLNEDPACLGSGQSESLGNLPANIQQATAAGSNPTHAESCVLKEHAGQPKQKVVLSC